jgi:hypothetical protein
MVPLLHWPADCALLVPLQLTTRSFANAEGYLMVPLLDMANHVRCSGCYWG